MWYSNLNLQIPLVPVLPLALWNIDSLHKRPVPIGIQLSADPLLAHANMTRYCKSLMSFAKANKLKNLSRPHFKGSCWPQPRAWWLCILKTSSEKNSSQAPLEGSLQNIISLKLLTTDATAKLESIEPWINISQW